MVQCTTSVLNRIFTVPNLKELAAAAAAAATLRFGSVWLGSVLFGSIGDDDYNHKLGKQSMQIYCVFAFRFW